MLHSTMERFINAEAQTTNATLEVESRRKPCVHLCTDVEVAAHAVCVRTTMQSQYTGEFPTFSTYKRA